MALTEELNRTLTQVGAGTPGGELLRRYWMPLCPASELTAERPKKRVRVMGEDLVLFRTRTGAFGLIPERCPHRHVSLYHGFVEDDGLRCAYHGWKYAPGGECIDQPFEPADSKLKALACRPAYAVQALCGILFGYLGPAPAPELPRWETLVRKDGTREIDVMPVHHCNWVQVQENSHDPVHTYYLHGQMLVEQGLAEQFKAEVAYYLRPIEDYSFSLCREATWTGIRKVRTFGGERPESEVGHPAVFPNILIVPTPGAISTQFRTPIDDEHTYQIRVAFSPAKDGSLIEQADDDIPVTYHPHPARPDGEYDLTNFGNQDLMAWESPGPIFDRSQELLGASDAGITMFRKLLREQIKRVQDGDEPDGVIRDPALNQIIAFTMSEGQAEMMRELDPESAGAGTSHRGRW
jgi:5,5'-dehydrodivanillate O-demethylase oxygenase subunit